MHKLAKELNVEFQFHQRLAHKFERY